MRQMQKEKLLPEQTAEKIREYIESNGMKTGDKLPNEFQLAEICGVGRSTIREAIKLLVFSGKVEVIRGSGTYIKKEKEGAEMMELEKYTLGSLKRAVFEGDVETGSLMSGQVAGMVHEERSLKDIIEGLFKEYEEEKKRVMEVHL